MKLRPRSQQFTILALRAATDPILIPGITPINAIHLTELRTALNDAYLAVGRTPPTYIGPTAVADHQSHPPERAPLQRPRPSVNLRPNLGHHTVALRSRSRVGIPGYRESRPSRRAPGLTPAPPGNRGPARAAPGPLSRTSSRTSRSCRTGLLPSGRRSRPTSPLSTA